MRKWVHVTHARNHMRRGEVLTSRKKIILGVVFAVMSSLMVAGPASAAHCQNAEKTSPGFSYFGTGHVQESTHGEGSKEGPHMGTSGASNCRDTTGSPFEHAPFTRK
jgi:hypothetical protein